MKSKGARSSALEAARKQSASTHIWSVTFVMVTVLNLLVCTIGQSIAAGTPLYIKSIGGTSSYSGVLLAAYILSALVARFAAGPLVDRKGRRLTMVIGAVLLIIGPILPIAADLPATLFISRILQGAGFSFAQTAINASAADALPQRRLGEGLGYFGLGQALAMAAGPALAVWLVGFEYHQALSIGQGILATVMLCLALCVRYEKNPQILPTGSGYREAWKHVQTEEVRRKDPAAVLANGEGARLDSPPGPHEERSFLGRLFEKKALYGAVPLFFITFATTVFISYTSLYAQSMGYANPSLFFLVAAVTSVVIRLVSSKIMDRLAPFKLLVFPVVAGALALLGLWLLHNELAYALCGMGYGMCIGIAIPLLNAVAVKTAPTDRFGAVNALFYLINDIAFGIGIVGWGFVLDAAGFGVLFAGGICSEIIALIAAAILFRVAAKRTDGLS